MTIPAQPNPALDRSQSSSESTGSSTSSTSSSGGSNRSEHNSAPLSESAARNVEENSGQLGEPGQVATEEPPAGDANQQDESDTEGEKDLSWVSINLRGLRSRVQKGSPDMKTLSALLFKGWKIEGMEKGEDIATWTDDLKFTMYRIVFQRMGIVPPFTRFQRHVLRYLRTAPSQLNPNAWAFLQGYEDVLRVLNRPVTIKLFFHLFELSYLYEPGSKGARKEAVSFKNRKQYNFFKPYMESLPTGWKKEFFWVVPIAAEALKVVAQLSGDNSGGTPLFPFVWTLAHFQKKPGQYSFPETDLDDQDQGTIQRLKKIASLVPGGRIKIKKIVDARNRAEVRDALVEMTNMQDFDALEQWAAEANEGSPPPTIPEAHAGAASVIAGSGSQSGPRSARAGTPTGVIPIGNPRPSQEQPGKRGRSSEQGGQQKKKHKSSKTPGQDRSPKLNLLGLSDQDCARFKDEPFEVVAEMMKAAGTLFRKYQDGEVDRMEGRRLAHKYSLLEDNLVDKNFKLNSALSLLAEVRGERDSLLQRLKELEPQIQAVAEYEQKLKEADDQIMAAVTARTEAEAARDRALAEKAEFEKDVEKEVGRLTSMNKELHSQVASLKDDLDAMERNRDEFQARFKDVLGRAKGAAEQQFENAVNQIKLLHPGLEIDPRLVRSSHRVADQEIVLPEKVVKGQVVQERAVVFRVEDA